MAITKKIRVYRFRDFVAFSYEDNQSPSPYTSTIYLPAAMAREFAQRMLRIVGDIAHQDFADSEVATKEVIDLS